MGLATQTIEKLLPPIPESHEHDDTVLGKRTACAVHNARHFLSLSDPRPIASQICKSALFDS